MRSIVFVSNFLNHHQIPLSQALFELTGGNYHFIATEDMNDERKNLGYAQHHDVNYLKSTFRSQEERLECEKLIDEADIVLFGSAPQCLIKNRMKAGKLVFKYSERPLKNGLELKKYLGRFILWHRRNPINKPVYLLCASAYASGDYKKFALFPGKKFKWGYFPQLKIYDNVQNLLEEKVSGNILWAGRFLDWKHPDDALKVAKMLKDDGYKFRMQFVGTGKMESTLKKLICEYKLENCVEILGSMSPEKVRNFMEKSGVFLFTSDKREGWGAVLNEAMNSGCAVVASDEIGSVPYLLQDGENGYVYKSGDVTQLYERVKELIENPEKQRQMGLRSYYTIKNMWNSDVAAKRLLELADELLENGKAPDIFEDGPCSKC